MEKNNLKKMFLPLMEIFFVILFLFFFFFHNSALCEDKFPIPSDTKLMLPLNSGLTPQWVIVPKSTFSTNSATGSKSEYSCFDIGMNGDPWFEIKGNILFDPLKGIIIETNQDFQEFVWLQNNELLLCTENSLGALGSASKSDQDELEPVTKARFKPLMRLPYKEFKLRAGNENVLYLIGHNPETMEDEVYLLKEENGKAYLSNIFTTKMKVLDAAGNGKDTYLVIDGLIIKLLPEKKDVELILKHKTEKVSEIEFSQNAGLFYATEYSVGFIGKDNKFEFLKSPGAKIRLRENSLFILLSESYALLKIDGIENFNKLGSGQTQK